MKSNTENICSRKFFVYRRYGNSVSYVIFIKEL